MLKATHWINCILNLQKWKGGKRLSFLLLLSCVQSTFSNFQSIFIFLSRLMWCFTRVFRWYNLNKGTFSPWLYQYWKCWGMRYKLPFYISIFLRGGGGDPRPVMKMSVICLFFFVFPSSTMSISAGEADFIWKPFFWPLENLWEALKIRNN